MACCVESSRVGVAVWLVMHVRHIRRRRRHLLIRGFHKMHQMAAVRGRRQVDEWCGVPNAGAGTC
jgi:hypothetical protein